jgi:hypothetical protein
MRASDEKATVPALSDPRVALLTASRRLCKERWYHWVDAYSEWHRFGIRTMEGIRYTDVEEPGALLIYPRYNVLAAILVKVEALIPEQATDFEDMRGRILEAVDLAESPFTKASSPLEAAVITQERERLAATIGTWIPADVAETEPLPHRRTLSSTEVATLRQHLREWANVDEDDGHHDYLGSGRADFKIFERFIGPDELRECIEQRGVRLVYEVDDEDHVWREVSIESAFKVFSYIRTAPPYDWITYEEDDFIAVGGWLLEALLRRWPKLADHLWIQSSD